MFNRAQSLFLMLLAVAAPVIAPAPARADPYESFLDVETEQDLYDALSVHQIDSDTFERLLDLLARGVNLDVASRQELYELPNLTYGEVDAILAYRAQRTGHGGLGDGRGLVVAGVLEELRYEAIAPFLLMRSSAPGWSGVRGWAQVQTRSSFEERDVPPLGLRVRASGFGWWTGGVAVVVTRQRLDDVRYDPNRQTLIAEDPEVRAAVPKAYLRWEDERHAVLLGSYRAGFGQRLVFDNTGAEQPAGFAFDDQLVSSAGLTRACKLAAGEAPSPCAAEEGAEPASPAPPASVTPDIRWREALLGAAFSAKRLSIGPGWLALHAWGSYAERAVYQYELVDRARCADPRRDEDPGCAALAVVQQPDGPLLSPAARHAYQTLPAMFAEALLGGNATYWLDRRTRLGLTGYAARSTDLVEGVALGTQESSRLPGGQRFGALGAEIAMGQGSLELAAELARSFDELPRVAGVTHGGGFGAVARAVLSGRRTAGEGPPGPVVGSRVGASSSGPGVRSAGGEGPPGPVVGSRVGDRARPPLAGASSGGELELTARYYQATFVNPYARPIAAADELEGQRARDEAGVRARVSWSGPRGAIRASLDAWSTLAPRVTSDLRAELQPSPRLRLGAALALDAKCGRSIEFDVKDGVDDSSSCADRRFSSRLRATAALSPTFQLTAQAQHELVDEPAARQHRLTLWLIARRRAFSGLHLRAHLRYRDDALGRAAPRALTGSTELRLPLGAASRLSFRLDGQLEVPPAGSPSSSSPSAASAAARTLSLGVTYDLAL
jgi:hypothetical protein